MSDRSTKLNQFIEIDNWFSRSINIERDATSDSALNSYVPTSVSKKMISSFLEAHTKDIPHQRSWSLIGPYGSGKSSFALFLKGLLSESNSLQYKIASKKLLELDKSLHKKHQKLTSSSDGFLTILLTGSMEPIEEKIYESCLKSFLDSDIEPKLKKRLANDYRTKPSKVNSELIFSLLGDIEHALVSSSKSIKGITIVIDELGKFVEYAGRKRVEGDIYILQELAERAVKPSKIQLSLIVMLHQSIEHYAKDLDQTTKNEWLKIGQRFEEISFLENIEQSVRIVSKAIIHNFEASQLDKLKKRSNKILKVLADQNSLPGKLSKEDAEELFLNCYPLHPVTAIILPLLSQKLAQNERTLFSFLGSSETHGFQNLLEEKNLNEYILPNTLYDYFISNQGSYIADHYTHRRWIEVQNSLDRLGDESTDLVNLIKTIGLLNIAGSFGNFKCSRDLLEILFDKEALVDNLKILESKSLISFRKFNSEYRIWQGSDFDLEQALSHEMAQFEDFSLSDELNKLLPPKPVVAKKASVESHTLRVFNTSYLNERDFLSYQANGNEPKILYLLRDNSLKIKDFKSSINRVSANSIVVAIDSSSGLENMSKELASLRLIFRDYPEIQSDPIAKREVSDQIEYLEEQISVRLQNSLLDKTASWYWKNKKVVNENTRQFQRFLSTIVNEIYCYSPVIPNELLNRDFISGQGQSARTRLIQAMHSQSEQEDIGLNGKLYPPERVLFESLLKLNSLVKFSGEKTVFVYPAKNNQFFKTFEMLKEELLSASSGPITFKEIQEKLSSPPFGIKAGLHPVIFMVFYMTMQDNIALYEDNQFRPYLDSEAIDRFVRTKTNAFSFQLYSFEGQTKLIEEYSKEFSIESSKKDNSQVLAIARRLTKSMHDLPDFSQNTRAFLSDEAIAFRTTFNLSRSPQDLLFKDIPSALKIKETGNNKIFSSKLHEVITELESSYNQLLLLQMKKIEEAFKIAVSENLNHLRTQLIERFNGFEEQTIGLNKTFITKLVESETDDQFWLETILNFLVQKNPQKWNDEDVTYAELKLQQFSDQLKDVEKMHFSKNNDLSQGENTDASKIDIYVLKSVKKGGGGGEEILTLPTKDKEKLELLSEEVSQLLADKNYKNKLDKLGALAAIVNSLMEKDEVPLRVINKDEEV